MATLIIHVFTYPYCNMSALLVVGVGAIFALINHNCMKDVSLLMFPLHGIKTGSLGSPLTNISCSPENSPQCRCPKNPGEESVAERSQGCEQGVIKDVNLWIPRLKGHIWQ